jgi:quinol monooxygenase YgiN
MSAWSKDELHKIAAADDLHIAPFREDGVTYGTPTWIWSVAVEGALYVRAYNGQKSSWYQAAMRQKAGRITAAGMTRNVAFEPVKGAVNERIDEAYRAKYHGSPYLKPMIGAGARSATVRVMPRGALGVSKLASAVMGRALSPEMAKQYVQIAHIEIDPAQLENYQAAVREQIEAAIREEPGVLVLYAVSDKDNPARVTVFEIYRDMADYKAHLESAHFKKYKAVTEKIVKSLTLVRSVPIMLGAKGK